MTPTDDRFRLRLRYGKQGRSRYLGHLDMMRSLERTIRRAAIPYVLTQGFNQRMKVAYSAALPLGAASSCEWLDIYVSRFEDPADVLARMRANVEPGLPFLQAAYVDLRLPALQAWLDRCSWRVTVHTDAPDAAVREAWEGLVAQGSFEFRRGAKVRRCDLRRTLVGVGGCRAPGAPGEAAPYVLELDTRSSNDGALRPEAFVRALWETPGLCGLPQPALQVERLGQWHEGPDGALLAPLPEGAGASVAIP